ncbi:MAG: hypothetical protein HDR00_00545 [Lachnospiraceae bacterium]|nr:hypothetical protein [Lachnospiraceae bacterium]
MEKKRLLLAAVCLSLVLTGCGMAKEVDTTTVFVKKDGTVEENIVTDFDKDYYSVGGLQQSLAGEISEYNQAEGQDSVTLGDVEADEEKNQVRVKITYSNGDNYSRVHNQVFFCGTVSDAYNAGYTFVPMIDQETGASVSETAVLELGSKKIVISEESVNVNVSGNITHVSEGVTLMDKKTAVLPEDGDKLSYIIYD